MLPARASGFLSLGLFIVCLRAGNGAADDTAFFENEVRPILMTHCLPCHGGSKAEAGLRLNSPADVLRGGDSGPAVSREHPETSRLLQAVRRLGGLEMPPDEPLADRQIAVLERWINLGLPWPDGVVLGNPAAHIRGGPITDEEREHWSLRPVTDPGAPEIDRPAAAGGNSGPPTEIDRFLLQSLFAVGLEMRPPADRRTLIRRATFDMTGLPPAADEVQAFVDDTRPDAFSLVVERLLQSPAYGERWGRHWLDVVRYSDTAGETADYPTPLAWKYRNWVIAAFNDDLPYDQFVQEQIAGDLLAFDLLPDAPVSTSAGAAESPQLSAATQREFQRRMTATGFIAVSRRFGFDVENYHHLTIQDTIDTTGQSILGLTLGCARCHDHKYDPVNMQDYYSWYGIFESTRYSFPGSEEKKRPYDLFAATPVAAGQIAAPPMDTPLIYGAIDRDAPHDAAIQLRGDPLKPGEIVARRNLEILGGEPVSAGGGSGRRDLAHWLTRPSNPLTSRVMVNRIWQHHFGTGLVATENDFGRRGQRPSHPQLLDWLATRFVQSGWSVKAMHRLIMNTAAYQQTSDWDAAAGATDPDNRLLWRFARRRLSAEEIRDAMLSVSGHLDRSVPEAHPFPAVDTWGFTQHAPFYAVYPTHGRSVYLMQQRLKRHPFLALFDGADPNVSTGARLETTVPTQALFLMNSEFVHEQAAGFSERLSAGEHSETERIERAWLIAFARMPSAEETKTAHEFLQQAAGLLRTTGTDESAIPTAAWQALARTLLTRNEFLFVD